jgi:hypothetical protein
MYKSQIKARKIIVKSNWGSYNGAMVFCQLGILFTAKKSKLPFTLRVTGQLNVDKGKLGS